MPADDINEVEQELEDPERRTTLKRVGAALGAGATAGLSGCGGGAEEADQTDTSKDTGEENPGDGSDGTDSSDDISDAPDVPLGGVADTDRIYDNIEHITDVFINNAYFSSHDGEDSIFQLDESVEIADHIGMNLFMMRGRDRLSAFESEEDRLKSIDYAREEIDKLNFTPLVEKMDLHYGNIVQAANQMTIFDLNFMKVRAWDPGYSGKSDKSVYQHPETEEFVETPEEATSIAFNDLAQRLTDLAGEPETVEEHGIPVLKYSGGDLDSTVGLISGTNITVEIPDELHRMYGEELEDEDVYNPEEAFDVAMKTIVEGEFNPLSQKNNTDKNQEANTPEEKMLGIVRDAMKQGYNTGNIVDIDFIPYGTLNHISNGHVKGEDLIQEYKVNQTTGELEQIGVDEKSIVESIPADVKLIYGSNPGN